MCILQTTPALDEIFRNTLRCKKTLTQFCLMTFTKMEEQSYPTRAEALRPEEPKRDAGDKSPDSVHRLDSELNFQMALTNLNHICDVMLPQIEKAIARCESIMKEQDPPIKVNTVPLGAKGTSSVQPKHTARGGNGSAPFAAHNNHSIIECVNFFSSTPAIRMVPSSNVRGDAPNKKCSI